MKLSSRGAGAHGQAPLQLAPDPAADAARTERAGLVDAWLAVTMRPDLHQEPVQRKKAEEGGDKTNTFPWRGKTVYSSVAELRSTPKLENYGKNTIAKIEIGTPVEVLGQSGDFYRVKVEVKGESKQGYLLLGQVEYVGPSASGGKEAAKTGPNTSPSMGQAFVIVKRAERDARAKGAGFAPAGDARIELDAAVAALEGSGRYQVDDTTYQVTFVKAPKKQIKIDTIEDFILFVEYVERMYSDKPARDIAGEIRQLWFSDENWEVLVDTAGITEDDGKMVDIESKPHALAMMFDMKNLAPEKGGKKLTTRMGTVDIGHVMAGIDAYLNGSPKSYPKERMKKHGHDSGKAELKYETLHDFSDGDPKAFATWAGDLGQAYAAFIYSKYKKGERRKLESFVAEFAKPQEILGDIHGYIAVRAWAKIPIASSPTGAEFKLSNVLRDLYLVEDKGAAGNLTYEKLFAEVSGQSGKDLKKFVYSSAMSFAHPWYAKVALDDSGWWGGTGIGGAEILANHIRDFSELADKNEMSGSAENTLEGLVDKFMMELLTQLE